MKIIRVILKPLKTHLKLKSFGVRVCKLGFKKGFTKSTLDVCGITKDNYKTFLKDRDYVMGHPYNGSYSSIIDNKLWLPMLLHKYKDLLPAYYFFIDEYGLLPLEDSIVERSSVRLPVSAFFETLKQKKILCLKHTHSAVGRGFMLVKQEKGNFYLNNKLITKEELESKILSLRQYVVTEYVYQHPYSSAICDTSLNSIRFLCVWDYKKKEFFVARSFHRFGCNGNIVDNIGSGNGILVFVNPETGQLKSEGAINVNGSGDQYASDIIHPDHNISLSGLTIPRYLDVKEKLLQICNENSFLRYVGFDVAITEEGFKIIELNSFSALEVTQQREGFLADERLRKILKQ